GRGVIQLGVRHEWGAKLITLLVDEAKGFLDGRANRISVSQALAMHFASAAGLQDYIRELLDRPEDAFLLGSSEVTLAGLPEDSAGQQIADLIRKFSNNPTVIVFPSADDISLLRLSGGLSSKMLRD